MHWRSSRRGGAQCGFSLVEILISTLLVAGVAAALLQSVALALQADSRADRRWRSTIELWNRAHSGLEAPTEELRPIPFCRPIRRIVVRNQETGVQWEVLRAQK